MAASVVALTCSALLLVGCAQLSDNTTFEFGPVYSTESITDPLVEKAVQGAEKEGKVESAEIRGFLVDWVIRDTSRSASMVEFVVMKDGNAYRRGGFGRPAAAFGRKAPKRLGPEPLREAEVREQALTRAHEVVSAIYPKFASVDPAAYNYLLRIYYKDGSHDDIWVDPDVDQVTFFREADTGLIGPIYRVDNITDPFVAEAFYNIETTGSSAVSVQIGGYFVRWRLKAENDQEILEYVVMKNGSLFKETDRNNQTRSAPSSKPMLPENESEAEAISRQIALKHAQEYVEETQPKFREVEPLVHEYLLNISRKDRSDVYAWVRPDGTVRKQQIKLMLDDVQRRF